MQLAPQPHTFFDVLDRPVVDVQRETNGVNGAQAHDRVCLGIAAHAVAALREEIDTFPKPGLVSHIDSGSHTDMDAALFYRSAAALQPYFFELAMAGARDDDMAVLRKIGLRAERAMSVATGGVNTHRGAIFGMGLLCAAAGRRLRSSSAGASDSGSAHVHHVKRSGHLKSLGDIVAARWGPAITAGPRSINSNGAVVMQRYGVGGAREEAGSGFPAVFKVGLPALRDAPSVAPEDGEAARVHACFALIATLDDTNLLHRGGLLGLRFAQDQARRFLADGSIAQPDWRNRAYTIHQSFVRRNLSPGGAADVLAMSLFVRRWTA